VTPSRNLELKSRYPDLARAARVAEELGASHVWTKRQTDTYFNAPRGRLKLRESEGRVAELIAYERPDTPDQRESVYHLVPIPDAHALKSALAASLGVRVVVDKRRTLYMWHNVRIHLDEVDNLGSFIEFEALLARPEDEADSPGRLAHLTDVLGIRGEDRVAQSYSDLILAANSR
jgi:predicted adenylyl cyclase CyaB